MKRVVNGLMVLVGISGLILVRVMEDRLFYDPFLEYFHSSASSEAFPSVDWLRLIVGHFFRFFLNLFFSLIVIHFMFGNPRWTKQAALLLGIVFGVTFPLYLYCVGSQFAVGQLFSFYVRRFVIQPLFLLLLVPMFYYRRELEKKKG
ncbi:exosortase F system-associated membrane protein [Bergeyella sp. RCAD1439]|uniref:exosortase F system-associated membrane protein n=1 Tax=Bergeyella anatis TaxID=3113737 RepID=UPI002E170B27|nr:exosortase F system-associated protein [Bergeyella sp. RCAD1439]